ncbi:MAG: hypothetical protein JXQ82_07860 [Methanomicrobiaceae archaeon]|nr:hypothetical protein [Methanomicrobiaceae archaeon]
MSPKSNPQDISSRSKKHLLNLRAVYQKNSELIDEFVKTLRFECSVKENDHCADCEFAYKEEESDLHFTCRMFCCQGIQKLDGLLKLVRKDLPPAQQIIGVCITVSCGNDVGPDYLPFVDDWIVRGKSAEELVKNVLDTVAGDMIENESDLFEDYAQALAGSKVALLKAGEV